MEPGSSITEKPDERRQPRRADPPPLAWNDPDFTDPAKLDQEMRRVFDICHGCRRCFNLCDSFPRLFDLVNASPSGEVQGVKSGFAQVVRPAPAATSA